MCRRDVITLLVILLAAFAVRLTFNIAFQALTSGPDPDMGTEHLEYDQLARNLLAGHGYRLSPMAPPTAVRPPGTPFILAAIYAVCGEHYATVRIIFSLLGALTCLVLFFVARRFVPDHWALAAAAVLALDPAHAYYSMHLFSETPWTLMITFAILLYFRAEESGRRLSFITQGIVLGLAALTRPIALVYPFFQAALVIFNPTSRSPRRWMALIPILLMLATVLPWSLRNAARLGRFALISTQGGTTLYGANNEVTAADPRLAGRWIIPDMTPRVDEIKSAGGEVERDRAASRLGWEFARTHPGAMARLTWWKLIRLAQPWPGTPNAMFNWAVALSYGLMIPFLLVGLARLLKQPLAQTNIPIVSALGMIAFNTVLMYGDHRFRISIEPVLVLLTVLGLHAIVYRITGRDPARTAPA